MTPRRTYPRVLIVEGKDELRVLPELLEPAGVPWPKGQEPVRIEEQDGIGKILEFGFIENTARVWEAASGTSHSLQLADQDGAWATPVVSAAFSSDGTRVITTSWHDTVQIWNLPFDRRTLAEWRAIADRSSPYVLAKRDSHRVEARVSFGSRRGSARRRAWARSRHARRAAPARAA